jgi:DNA-directed RNA polymerase specialized sigma24 family protein
MNQNIIKIIENEKLMENYKGLTAYYRTKTSGYFEDKQAVNGDILNEQDIIQNSILALLESKQETIENIENVEHFFNGIRKNKRINLWKRNKRGTELDENGNVKKFIEFTSEIVEFTNDPLLDNETKIQYRDTIRHILNGIKKPFQKIVFTMYFLKGYSMEAIANKYNTNKMEISRQIGKVKNRIDQLKVSELYDHRFIFGNGAGRTSYPEKIPASEKGKVWEIWNKEDVLKHVPAEKTNKFKTNSCLYDSSFAREKAEKAETCLHEWIAKNEDKKHETIDINPNFNEITIKPKNLIITWQQRNQEYFNILDKIQEYKDNLVCVKCGNKDCNCK